MRLRQVLIPLSATALLVTGLPGALAAGAVAGGPPSAVPAAARAAASLQADPASIKPDRIGAKVKPLKVKTTPREGLVTGGNPRVGTSVTPPPTSTQVDPALQLGETSTRSLGQLGEVLDQWNGMSGATPNDTTGDVGPNHFVQAINSSFQVFDKTGTSLEGPTGLGQLWNNGDANVDACEQNAGDPIVLYDNLADRWMISQFSRFAPFRNVMCLAVSQTADPRLSQGYYSYSFDMGEFPDYLKLGAWTDGYYFSANGDPGAMVAVYDRSNMLNGNPAGFVQFTDVADLANNSFNVLMPSDVDGSTPPPAGSPGYFYRPVDGDNMGGGADRVELFTADVDWANPGASTLTGPANIALVAFDLTVCGFLSFGCIPQPGNSGLLDPVNETGMFRFPYRNYGDREVLAGNFTVDTNAGGTADRAGIRWFVLERSGGGAWAVADQGTYAPQPVGATAFVHRFMGSLAMDRYGNLALGHTRSSSANPTSPGGYTGFASAVYTGRQADDPAGLLPQPETLIQPGTGALGAGGADTRWGDYYTMVVDPVDDCTFWYTGDYATTVRQSVIASFRFADCATDLTITKSASPQHPNAGEEVVYTITVTNDGDIGAADVVVSDVLPPQANYLTDTDSCTGVAVGATGTLTCELGTLAAGASRSFEIKVSLDPDLGGPTSVTNTATVSSASTDLDDSDNTASLTHLVNERADLRVTKLCKPDSGPAPAGTSGTCTVLVTNDGPSTARLVNLTDTHVSDGAFTIGTPTTEAGSCVVAGDEVTCGLGSIDPGEAVQVDVPVSSDDDVDVNDVARVVSGSPPNGTPDPNTTNNEASAGLAFDAQADLSITKQGPATAVAGTQFDYTLSVDNDGPSTAQDVVVTDELPDGVDYVSAVASVGSFTASNGTVTWNLGNVAPADPVRTLTITVEVKPDAVGQLDNSAFVGSGVGDPDTADNVASWTTAVSAEAGLTLTKTDSPDPVVAGAQLTYTVTVGNGGPSTAQDVVVEDTLPDGTTLVSAVGGTGTTACAEVQTGVVSCEVGALGPGDSETIFITVLVDSSVADGATLTNEAEASSPTDPDGASASATTAVVARADLWMEKTGTAPAGNPAGALIYRLTVHNEQGSAPDDTPTSGAGGPSDAQSVVVTDPLPLTPKKLKVQYLTPGCTYSQPTHTVTCTTPTVPASTSVTFEVQVQIQGSSGTVTNRATVSSTTTDPAPGNNTDTVANVVQGGTGKGKKP
jgi:uncharacterized repeat protein (TIGR01451 family)